MNSKRTRTSRAGMLLLCLCILLIPSVCFAQSGPGLSREAVEPTPSETMGGTWFSRGPFKIKGGLEVGWLSRSNIYLSENNTVSDNILQFMPSLGVRHEFTQTSFWSLEYYGTYAYYQENDENDWDSHYVPFDFFLGGKTGPFVEVSNDFWRSSDPFGSEDLYKLGQKTARTQNDAYIAPGWTFSEKTKAKVYGRYIILEYDQDQDRYQNQREWDMGGIFYYKFWPKTSMLFQYTFVNREYVDQPSSSSEDQYRHEFYVGLTWDATSKLQGEVKLGYGIMNYDNEYNTVGQKYEEKNTWLAEVSVSWQATPKLMLLGSLQRAIRQSTQGLVGTEFPNNYYVDTYATLGARWTFIRNLTAFATVGAGLNEYNSLDGTEARDDDVFKGQVGLEYAFLKYLYAQAYYLYDYKSSNKPNLGYTDNVFYMGVGGRF